MKSIHSKNITPNTSNQSPFFQKGSDKFLPTKKSKPFFNAPSIQAKLTVNEPGDKYEQEADSMADKVVQRLSDKTFSGSENNSPYFFNTPLSMAQRKCASCEQEEKLQKKEAADEKDTLKGSLQKKPIFESNAEPPDEDKNIQKKCAGCEKEEKLLRKEFFGQKKSDVIQQSAPSNIENSLNSSKGSGSALPQATREEMESSFGADFSGVKIHNDSASVQMNKNLNAQAFTHGSDIYFNSGKYNSNNKEGWHLLAHELTHVVQQSGVSISNFVQRSCGAEEIGGPEGCEKLVGDLKGPRYLFAVNCDSFAKGNDIDLEKDAEMIQDNANVEIHGFASVEGNPDYNQKLSCARAIVAKNLVESVLLKQRVNANIRIFSHGPQRGNRTVMRGVTVLIQNPAPRINIACPPPKDFQAGSLSDYIDLIKCVESSISLNNRQVLALFRQMYYGKDWSATSTTSLWDNVITCNVNPGDPRKLLHSDLFEALQKNVDVQGADIGHVFTGLESMMCPSAKVKVDDTFLVSDMLDDIANVEMSNEQFATWGGDLGAAVAAMASCWYMDDDERKKSKDCEGADLMKGIVGFLEIHAPDTDLEGDIIAFVMRANVNGIPCSGSLGQTLNLSAPVSELFSKYLSDKKSGSGQIDRYKCFADIIGANVVNGQIQNKDELVHKFNEPVLEFAKTYYVKIMIDVHGKIPPHRVVPFGLSMDSMMHNTPFAIRYFLAWIERKMNGAP